MSHEITIRKNGFAEAMYAGLEPAWHGLGQVVDEAPTSADAMKLAGLLWTVEQHPIQTIVSQEHMDEEGNPKIENDIVEIPDRVANVRSDNHSVLGVVGCGYRPVQNCEAFSFVDDLIETGEIRYEAAGSLRGGKTIWLLGKMPERIFITEQDTTDQYILFTNGHDGTRAVHILPTAVRVVCSNTLNLAMRKTQSTSRRMTFVHTGNIRSKLDEARQMLGLVNRQFESYAIEAKAMASVTLTSEQRSDYCFKLFPNIDGQNNTRREKTRAEIMSLMNDQTNTLAGMRGTAWAALNAVTQYVDHSMTKNISTKRTVLEQSEYRMASTIVGHGARIKAEAWENALALIS